MTYQKLRRQCSIETAEIERNSENIKYKIVKELYITMQQAADDSSDDDSVPTLPTIAYTVVHSYMCIICVCDIIHGYNNH